MCFSRRINQSKHVAKIQRIPSCFLIDYGCDVIPIGPVRRREADLTSDRCAARGHVGVITFAHVFVGKTFWLVA